MYCFITCVDTLFMFHIIYFERLLMFYGCLYFSLSAVIIIIIIIITFIRTLRQQQDKLPLHVIICTLSCLILMNELNKMK